MTRRLRVFFFLFIIVIIASAVSYKFVYAPRLNIGPFKTSDDLKIRPSKNSDELSDAELVKIAQSQSYLYPSGFYREDSKCNVYYEDNRDLRFTDSFDQALEFSNFGAKHSHGPKELVASGETEKYFEFQREDPKTGTCLLSRVHKVSYYKGGYPYSSRKEYDAPSEFKESDFHPPQTPQGLLDALGKSPTLNIPEAETPIDSLNRLLEDPNLIDSMSSRPDFIQDLVQRHRFGGTPLEVEELKKLNRGLLESSYAPETPQRGGRYEIIGYAKFKPLTLKSVKEFLEYLWSIKNYQLGGLKVLSSSIVENQDDFTQSIETLHYNPGGDWGLPMTVSVSREIYQVDKEYGGVTMRAESVRSISLGNKPFPKGGGMRLPIP